MLARSLIAFSLVLMLQGVLSADEPYSGRESERERERERIRDRERVREHRYITGRVVAVDDGDSCVVLDREGVRHRVALYGIDAPEHGQPQWDRAKECLKRKLYEKEVRFEPVEKDRDGRECAHVYLGNHHVNLDLIREGYAWHHGSGERIREFAEAEREARERRRGLWVDRQPVEPWKYRLSHPERERIEHRDVERERLEHRGVERERLEHRALEREPLERGRVETERRLENRDVERERLERDRRAREEREAHRRREIDREESDLD